MTARRMTCGFSCGRVPRYWNVARGRRGFRLRHWRRHGRTLLRRAPEHVLVHGVPVQILPAYNALVIEAIRTARVHDYEGVPVRVVDPEHLIALALQAGGARRRERAWLILQAGVVDRRRLRTILGAHGIDAEIPDDV